MPDEIEVDTDKLHETIHERLHEEGGSFLKQIALTTALLAAFAAVAALRAGATVNEGLVLKTESPPTALLPVMAVLLLIIPARYCVGRGWAIAPRAGPQG